MPPVPLLAVVVTAGNLGSTKALEKAMAPHSSTLAWKSPRAEEPARLQSMGSRRVGHDRATSLSLFTFTHWRRKWQPTPVFLPGESQGWGSLVGCCLWGHTESDMTEATQQQQTPHIRGMIQCMSFCVWSISLSIISSRYIHVVACVRISFFF